ncbi:hemerythrin-like domain-containing protein [Sagittula marina]|uniref:Hemerythrin-like domain-containing protein n=1 Tax=Sagittula marina TaxID=943940 RepID=A0A7W6DK29_9RHOB|nr:hemerythrin domain-containing protein [Sagittula marina]MBB3984187.1 hemerythrin-like domain-containing protein [Sagittula marina]
MDKLYDLTERDGLPESLRVLLETFPREEWESHPNFAGLVAFWLDRHEMFRKLCAVMGTDAEAVMDKKMDPRAMQQRLSQYGGALLQQLHGHHQIEDAHYFPVLRKREKTLDRGFDILDRDHHAMDGLMTRFADGANGVLQGSLETGRFRQELTSFESLLMRHLADEEDLIVPVILKHGPDGMH